VSGNTNLKSGTTYRGRSLPQTLIASRGIMVVPTEPENTLANFIEKAKKNIVLIEAKE